MRYLLLLFGLFCATAASAQTPVQPVLLQWKIKPGDSLLYLTRMNDLDSVRVGDSIVKKNNTPYQKYMDTSSSDIIRKMREIVSAKDDFQYRSKLTNTGKNNIDVEMCYWKPADSAAITKPLTMDYFPKLSGFVSLRGSVSEKGKVTSFYVKNSQRNIIALFFELPGKPVKPGDSWPLDVQFITTDYTFKCDSSFRKNSVTLVELKKSGKETIAVLRYDIEEFVNGDWMITPGATPRKVFCHARYSGTAEFSVEKGRWISYNCVMIMNAHSLFGNDTIKEFVLLPK